MRHRLSPLLFKSLVQSLFIHGTIETSEKKAKATKGLIDKIINLAKNKNEQSSSANRKYLLRSYLNKDLQDRLVKEIVPKLGSRTSGYTSLVRLGQRLGDNTMMVRMSLIGAERLSVLGSQLSDKGKSVISKSVTEKQKTDNRKLRKAVPRRKK